MRFRTCLMLAVISILFSLVWPSAAGCAEVDSAYAAVNLNEYLNNDGISWEDDPLDGDLTFTGMTIPAESMPLSGEVFTVGDTPFILPPYEDGALNNVLCYSQDIAVPEGNYQMLWILATSVSATRKLDITLVYSDGSEQVVSQRVADMKGAPGFAKFKAVEADHRHTSEGSVGPGMAIYAFGLPIDGARRLVSIQLPELPTVRLFAITLQIAENQREG